MSKKPSPYVHPLAAARGLGSAKSGTHHWILQRVTALVLVPLSIWFAYTLTGLVVSAKDATDLAIWLGNPVHAIALSGLLIALFWHATLGLQVVIEDYIHCNATKFTLLLVSKIICYGAALLGVLSVVKMHFGIA